MDKAQRSALLEAAGKGITTYLDGARKEGRIDQTLYEIASKNVLPNLTAWLEDPHIDRISPRLKEGVAKAIEAHRWEDLVNAYRQNMRFGTGGIRGMMAFRRDELVRIKEEGIDAPILKGPNTLNSVVLLRTSVGVAQFGKSQKPAFERVVIGYDTRVRGRDLAAEVAKLFLHYGYTVYFFDEPCPYPEVTFAIPYKSVKADVGIFISASHNDYRYNGYKLSCCNGSQFDPEQRDEMYEKHIAHASTCDIHLLPFEKAPKEKLVFLGGAEPVEGVDYAGREDQILNMHQAHSDQVKSFLRMSNLAETQKTHPLKIGFSAFHGAGRKAVPRMLRDAGLSDIRIITEQGLNEPDGLFPCFRSDPGHEEQPDPGDPHSAEKAVNAFKKQYGPAAFDELDILLGTDPDADRCGVVVEVPEAQRSLYDGKSYTLLPADDLWALVIWYWLSQDQKKFGAVPDAEKKFVVLSHTTSDAITRIAQKFGLGVVKTWVGFAALAAAVRDRWEGVELAPLTDGRSDPKAPLCHPFVLEYHDMTPQRSFNVAAMEQSNGFSALGGPPPDGRSLGVGGHVRDKDGTFAALLVGEVAAWAKSQEKTLFDLLDEKIFLDPDVGLYVNYYEPDPLIGEYPGIEGDRHKLAILRRALGCYQFARAGGFEIGGLPVVDAAVYRTGKYDRIYPATYDFQFPDEGLRFFFDAARQSHLTIRPSGTGNSLRFHVQLHGEVTKANLIDRKRELRQRSRQVVDHVRELLHAPRQ